MSKKTVMACSAAMIMGISSAHALNFAMDGFTGYTVMGNPCDSCDSLVNFAVYQNVDGNWTDDAFFDPANVTQNGQADLGNQFGSTIDSSAGYVYMYQPMNLDVNLTGIDSPLADFGVSLRTPMLQGITSAGYFGGVFLDEVGNTVDGNPDFDLDDLNAASFPFDTPNNGVPTRANEGSVGLTTTGTQTFAPASVTTANLISSPIVNGGLAESAIIWEFGTGGIPTDFGSNTLFFTSNHKPGYRWAETESAGGSGAAGDVAAPVPVPASALLFGPVIAAAGFLHRSRKGRAKA